VECVDESGEVTATLWPTLDGVPWDELDGLISTDGDNMKWCGEHVGTIAAKDVAGQDTRVGSSLRVVHWYDDPDLRHPRIEVRVKNRVLTDEERAEL
jgi:hypothetical protein